MGLKRSFKEASEVNYKAIIGLNVHIKSMVVEFPILYKDAKTQFVEELKTHRDGNLGIFSESFFN